MAVASVTWTTVPPARLSTRLDRQSWRPAVMAPADQDRQGYRRVEPGDIADGIADQRDHHPNRTVITEKANQFAVT